MRNTFSRSKVLTKSARGHTIICSLQKAITIHHTQQFKSFLFIRFSEDELWILKLHVCKPVHMYLLIDYHRIFMLY